MFGQSSLLKPTNACGSFQWRYYKAAIVTPLKEASMYTLYQLILSIQLTTKDLVNPQSDNFGSQRVAYLRTPQPSLQRRTPTKNRHLMGPALTWLEQ